MSSMTSEEKLGRLKVLLTRIRKIDAPETTLLHRSQNNQLRSRADTLGAKKALQGEISSLLADY